MALVTVPVRIRTRWFFRPALFALRAAAALRMPCDQKRAGEWLADHALIVEIG